MGNKIQAVYDFWSNFGWPVYDENSVPDSAATPYITYHVSTGSLGDRVTLYGNLWDRSTSWERISRKALEIEEYVTNMYPSATAFDSGRLYIVKGSPFAQRMGEPGDDMMKRIYINLDAEFFAP